MKKISFTIIAFFLWNIVNAQEEKMTLSMQEAIDFAIENNQENKIASKNIEAAKERKWETTTIGLPQVSGTVDYSNFFKQQTTVIPAQFFGGNEGEFAEVIFGTQQSIDARLTLTQLIFDGSYLVGLQSAKTFLKITEQAKLKTEASVRKAVINAYGNVLVSEKSLEILEKNRNILEKNLYETEKIFENGLIEEENVEQLQLTLETLKSNIRNTERLKALAYQMLNITLGNSVATKVILTDSLESLAKANTDLSLFAKEFDINGHIDYQIALNNREAESLLLKFEKSKYLPTVNAFVNYGANSFSDDFPLFTGQEFFGYSLLGVSLNVPIFSSFGKKAKVAQAKIALENADFKLEQIKQQLNLQAASAKSEYQLSIENYDSAEKNLALAERIEKKQQIKFFEGISTSFDLSQAQNQLYTQQANFIRSMLDVIAKKAELETALNLPTK